MKLKVGDLIKVLGCEYARSRKAVGKHAKVVCIYDGGVSCRLIGDAPIELVLLHHEYARAHRTVKFCR